MFIDTKNGDRRWNKPYSRGTTEIDGVTYPNIVWDDPVFRAAQGITWIEDPVIPADVSDATHYITRPDLPPYLEWAPKSAEQLAQVADSKALDAARRHLLDTDYLFTVDKYAQLAPDRKASLELSREEARQIIRDYEVKYPQPVEILP